MKTIRVAAFAALGVMLTASTAHMQDKPFVRVTQEQAMAALQAASDAAKGNYASLESNFQKEIRKIWGDYDNRTFPVYERAEMNVTVMGPAEMLLAIASQSLKRGSTIEGITYPAGATVYVAALSNESPDIVEVTVERDGKPVEPIQKNLLPKEMRTVLGGRQGSPRTVHEGGVVFPIAAFDPGGEVVVTAVADSGRKYSKTIFDRDLKKIQ